MKATPVKATLGRATVQGKRLPLCLASTKKPTGLYSAFKGALSLEKMDAIARSYAIFLENSAPEVFLQDFERFFFLRFGALVACFQQGANLAEKEDRFLSQMVLPALKRFAQMLLGQQAGWVKAYRLLEKYENRLLRAETIYQGRAAMLYCESVAFLCRAFLPTLFSLLDGGAGLTEDNMKQTFFYRILQYGVKDAFVYSSKHIYHEESQVFKLKTAMVPYIAVYFLFAGSRLKWCTEDTVNGRSPLHDLMPLSLEDAVWIDFRAFAKRHPVAVAGQLLFLEEYLLTRNIDEHGNPDPKAKRFYKKAFQQLLDPGLKMPPATEGSV